MAKPAKPIEALDLIGLAMAEMNARGTRQHPKFVRALIDATQEWKEQLRGPKCPHCGKRP